MYIAGAQPREWEVSCCGKFAGKSDESSSVSIIVSGRTAGPRLIFEPGPAFLGKASAPFTGRFSCTLKLSCYLSVVETSSGKENNLRTGNISLGAGCLTSDRFKIGSILSGQSDFDWVGTWRHVLP